MEPSHQKVINFATIALLVFVSSFTHWATVPYPSPIDREPMVTVNTTAWNSYITLQGISIQNWLVVFAALGIALAISLREYSIWKPSKWILIVLGIYGLAHSALLIGISLIRLGSLGVGPFLSLVAFILFTVLMSRDPEFKVL